MLSAVILPGFVVTLRTLQKCDRTKRGNSEGGTEGGGVLPSLLSLIGPSWVCIEGGADHKGCVPLETR